MTFCGILAKLEILLLALRVANLVNFSSFFFFPFTITTL